MINKRLLDQMNFISEVEKLKVIYRQNGIIDGSRLENSAEHSWHISLMAIILQEYSKEEIDFLKVIKMLLIHDLVEIYTGDTFLYDTSNREKIRPAEKDAADRIFSLLPENQKDEFIALWNEFENRETNESRYAAVMDNLQPILNHYLTKNENIKSRGLSKSQIIKKKCFIQEFSEDLWEYTLSIINESVKIGLYLDE